MKFHCRKSVHNGGILKTKSQIVEKKAGKRYIENVAGECMRCNYNIVYTTSYRHSATGMQANWHQPLADCTKTGTEICEKFHLVET